MNMDAPINSHRLQALVSYGHVLIHSEFIKENSPNT